MRLFILLHAREKVCYIIVVLESVSPCRLHVHLRAPPRASHVEKLNFKVMARRLKGAFCFNFTKSSLKVY